MALQLASSVGQQRVVQSSSEDRERDTAAAAIHMASQTGMGMGLSTRLGLEFW
jgi:hypothetical protein